MQAEEVVVVENAKAGIIGRNRHRKNSVSAKGGEGSECRNFGTKHFSNKCARVKRTAIYKKKRG